MLFALAGVVEAPWKSKEKDNNQVLAFDALRERVPAVDTGCSWSCLPRGSRAAVARPQVPKRVAGKRGVVVPARAGAGLALRAPKMDSWVVNFDEGVSESGSNSSGVHSRPARNQRSSTIDPSAPRRDFSFPGSFQPPYVASNFTGNKFVLTNPQIGKSAFTKPVGRRGSYSDESSATATGSSSGAARGRSRTVPQRALPLSVVLAVEASSGYEAPRKGDSGSNFKAGRRAPKRSGSLDMHKVGMNAALAESDSSTGRLSRVPAGLKRTGVRARQLKEVDGRRKKSTFPGASARSASVAHRSLSAPPTARHGGPSSIAGVNG